MNDKMNLHDSQNISEDTSLTAGEDTLSGDTNPVENNNKGSDSQQQILLAKAASSRADNNTVYRPPVRSNAVKKGKKKTKNRWVRPLIWILTVVLVSVLMAGTVIIAGMDFLGIGTSGSFEINVEKGATTAQIAKQLKDEGVIHSSLLFRAYIKLKKCDGTFKYGLYLFNDDLGYDSIINTLQTQGESAETVRVTIPEGSSVTDIAKLLEENNVCTAEQFYEAEENSVFDYEFLEDIPLSKVRYRLEGYLFPDTYEFYTAGGLSYAENAINRMLENFDKKFDADMRKKCLELGYSTHEILTLSSVVELEASSASFEDKQKVAAVFFNRLSWDEPKLLGSSPTAEYAHGNASYDTNKSEGIPPGPYCSTGIDAIKATLNPADNFKATYFVTDSQMNFYYTESLSEHNSVIASLKRQGKWLG
ncbi:MAG: endolytic transglycosylase MltG [bacterium]|nr:endolytic transglycosylase MltG [bacterium]